MDVTLDGLIREIQVSIDDVLDQLELAARRADELSDLGDSLLNHFVDRCRKSGKTWAEIGQHLGVTRQAAQKRFVSGPVTFERYTDRARLAINNAVDEAKALQHNYVGTEHLLLALFDTTGGISDQVLAELGITHAAIVEAVEQLIGRGETPVSGSVPFTPRAAKVLEQAVEAALNMGHNYIGTEHLLLALFRGQDGLAKKMLEERGASTETVKSKVVEKLGGFKQA